MFPGPAAGAPVPSPAARNLRLPCARMDWGVGVGASLHPVVSAAAEGTLPSWAVARDKRRAHMARVAELLTGWARSRGLPEAEVARWTSTGYLHDALRDEDPERLRDGLPARWEGIPGGILHGPAAAERLRADGVEDEELLRAVAFHTLGHREFGTLGRMLYAADFLEPGRTFHKEWRQAMRRRMPEEERDVVRAIVAARIHHLLDRNRPIRPETTEFWNSMTTGEAWAGASEV